MHKRIMVVGPQSEQTGGVVTFQRNLMIHSSLKERWTFVPFNISRPAKNRASAHHYKSILQQDPKRLFKSIGITAKNFLRFAPALKSIDLAQIQSSDYYAFWEASYYMLVAKQMGVPVCVRFGGIFNTFYEQSDPKTQRLIRWILSKPDGIVVQSGQWKTYFSQLTDPKRLHIVGNAIPKQNKIDRSNRSDRCKVLFICGPESKRKGLFELLPAVEDLNLELIIVAANEEARQEVKNRQLNNVRLLDSVSRETLREKLYPQADAFVIPSHGEGFPNSMLEAMASALPIIATPVGAIPEVIEDGKEGFIVPLGNIKSLRSALQKLASSRELQLNMGTAAWNRAMNDYELNKMFSRFETLWTSLI